MSQNIQQIFAGNPITSNASTDLMYFGQSPYGPTNDAAMTYANFAAQFGATYTPAALTKTDDTNVTLTLGGTPATALLQATSLTLGWAGQLALTRGGTNASLTASNGGVFYSTATAGAILAGTATANQVLLSGSTAAPAWSTATYPATTTINQILFSSAANTITGITTANSATLYTTTTGVPTFTAAMTNGQILIGSTAANPVLGTITAGTNISVTNAAGSITINSTGLASFSWNNVAAGTQALAVNQGYITNNGASLVTYTLPVTAAQGTTIKVAGFSAGGWGISQNTGQQINFGNKATTAGVGGSLSSTNQYDQISLLCVTANTTWVVLDSVGNITVV